MIVVVIPYIHADRHLAYDTLELHKELAGVDCTVVAREDKDHIGWPNMHNKIIKEFNFDYYCYSCADYVPGIDYIKLAIKKLDETRKGLCALNDGKWDGAIASAGIVTKKFYNKYGLFYSGYHSHGADDEITQRAIANNEYVYEPKASLREIDSRKGKENKNYNKADQKLYAERFAKGFK